MPAIRIAMVYAKDPHKPRMGMDLIRWFEMSSALVRRGYEVDMVTVNGVRGAVADKIVAVPISEAKWEDYSLVKVCYQSVLPLVPDHSFLAVRLARVVGKNEPNRDRAYCEEFEIIQKTIPKRANCLILNDFVNEDRWRKMYGPTPPIFLIPNGCPAVIPKRGASPYKTDRPVALYMGSLTSGRFVDMINEIGAGLYSKGWLLVVIGLNKLAFYGAAEKKLNDQVVHILPPVPVEQSWDYSYYADVGLALAAGPEEFANDISKIYYYLRSGLPVVCENRIANRHLVKEVGWGSIFEYGDVNSAISAIQSWKGKRNMKRAAEVSRHFSVHHSWDERAGRLAGLLEKNRG